MNNRLDFGIVFTVAIVAIFTIIAIVHSYIYRYETKTTKIVTSLAKIHMDDKENVATLNEVDAWGKPLHFIRHATDTSVSQTIISAGADGEFGSADDISYQDVDLNKSRLVGKWIGSRTKEFVKGLRESDTEPSRFEKLTEKPTTKPTWRERVFGKKKD